MSVLIKSKLDFQNTKGITNLAPATSSGEPLVFGQIGQATEGTAGIARIATQEAVNLGSADDTIITPKKLKTRLKFLLPPIINVNNVLNLNVPSSYVTFAGLDDNVLIRSNIYSVYAVLTFNIPLGIASLQFRITGTAASSWGLVAGNSSIAPMNQEINIPVTTGTHTVTFNGTFMTVSDINQFTDAQFQVKKTGSGTTVLMNAAMSYLGIFNQ